MMTSYSFLPLSCSLFLLFNERDRTATSCSSSLMLLIYDYGREYLGVEHCDHLLLTLREVFNNLIPLHLLHQQVVGSKRIVYLWQSGLDLFNHFVQFVLVLLQLVVLLMQSVQLVLVHLHKLSQLWLRQHLQNGLVAWVQGLDERDILLTVHHYALIDLTGLLELILEVWIGHYVR